MLDIKQKTVVKKEDSKPTDGGDITQLDGSPDPTAVSRVAMGGDAKTLDEHDDIYNTQWIDRLKGGSKPTSMSMEAPDVHELQEAYAKLFEGLAGIAKAGTGSEDCEMPEQPEQEDGEQEDGED